MNKYWYELSSYQQAPVASVATAELWTFADGDEPYYDPPGFQSQNPDTFVGPKLNRGHLIARQFGGHGGMENIVAMFAQFNNNRRSDPGMRTAEDAVEALMVVCMPILVDVEVAYHGASAPVLWEQNPHALPVQLIHYQAISPLGMFSAVMENTYYR